MQEDFLDAHQRHWEDAESLFQAQRWANSDHLYGMSAECGLKTLIEKIKGGSLGGGDRLHIMEDKKPDNAWSKYQSYISGHTLAAKLPLPHANPFSDWLASQRYAKQSNFDQVRVQGHKTGTQTVRDLIAQARIEGLLL